MEAVEGETPPVLDESDVDWADDGSIDIDPRTGRASIASAFGDLKISPVNSGRSAALLRDDGVQVMTELRQGEAQAEFDLTLPDGYELVADDDGGFTIRAVEADGPGIVIGAIEEPWAVDADGKEMDTTYSLDGNRIVQSVDTAGATFPVVADPRLTFGRGVYLNMTGTEMRAVAAASYATGALASMAACNISRLPVPVLRILRVVCNTIGSASALSILQGVRRIVNSNNVVNGGCYQMKIVPRGTGFKRVKFAGNCRA